MTWASALASPSVRAAALPAVTASDVACPSKYTARDLVDCWSSMMAPLAQVYGPLVASRGKVWQEPKMVVFGLTPPKNPCHAAEASDLLGSFYCDRNQTIYLSNYQATAPTRDYVARARKVKGVLTADAKRAHVAVAKLTKGYVTRGQATILAHEYAHHVSNLLGVDAWYQQQADKHPLGSSTYDRYAFAPEMAADCLSGYALAQGKRLRVIPGSAWELWGSRAYYAQANPFEPEKPVRSPFVYRNKYKGGVPVGYGGAYWRLHSFNTGWRDGLKGGDAVTKCYTAASKWKRVSSPTQLIAQPQESPQAGS